jgi:hypothetical protein
MKWANDRSTLVEVHQGETFSDSVAWLHTTKVFVFNKVKDKFRFDFEMHINIITIFSQSEREDLKKAFQQKQKQRALLAAPVYFSRYQPKRYVPIPMSKTPPINIDKKATS